jgi:death-on-curing protein
MPQASFGGELVHEDVFAMAAAYLFHIVSNHPIVDGNKRTGLLAALVFLDPREQAESVVESLKLRSDAHD